MVIGSWLNLPIGGHSNVSCMGVVIAGVVCSGIPSANWFQYTDLASCIIHDTIGPFNPSAVPQYVSWYIAYRLYPWDVSRAKGFKLTVITSYNSQWELWSRPLKKNSDHDTGVCTSRSKLMMLILIVWPFSMILFLNGTRITLLSKVVILPCSMQG